MAEPVTINLTELDDLVRRYVGAPRLIEVELMRVARWAALAIEALAKRYVPVDTGILKGSIAAVPRKIAGGVAAIAGTSVPYAQAVEEGREAGKPMPPTGSLLKWMAAHNIPEELEFVVRRAISRRGIPARPYLTRAFEELLPRIRQEFGQVAPRVLAQLGEAA